MKKILITGAHSYIGASVADYLARWPEKYAVDTLSVRGEKWKQADFSGYGLCAVLRKVIGILPDRVRGVSI